MRRMESQGFSAMLRAVFLVAVAQAALPVIDTNRKCFATAPGNFSRTGTTVKIGVRPWLSHQISSALLEIILKEYMHFTVVVYDLKDSNAKEWGEDLTAGLFDIDIESRELDLASDYGKKYLSVDKTVADLGTITPGIGYTYRRGLYVTPKVIKTYELSTWYIWYRDATALAASGLTMFGQDGLKAAVSGAGLTWPVCDTSKYSWCGTGALEGYWAPDTCKANPSSCAIAFMETVGTGSDIARFEQLTANHKINMIYAYAGSALATKVRALVAAGKDTVFISASTEPLPAEVKAKRLSFPDFFAGCDTPSAGKPSGSALCDYGDVNLYKLMSTRLRSTAPEAHFWVTQLQIYIGQLQSMIATTTSAGGTKTPFEAACNFLKTEYGKTSASGVDVPKCISNRKLKLGNGDLFFDSASLTCQATVAFPESQTPKCYANGASKGTIDRSATKVKICYHTWLSQNLVSDVAVILMKEWMGYDVVYTDLASSATVETFANIEARACHMDMEQWQSGVEKPRYKDFVATRKTCITLPTGYSGRSGFFVTPGVNLTKNPMATYWKWYGNMTNLKTTSLIRFDELGQNGIKSARQWNKKPLTAGTCTATWCGVNGTYPYEGAYVPPQCVSRPQDCIISVAPVSGYDTGFFETLTRVLGLNVIHTYYGWTMGDAVKEMRTLNRDTIHYHWEPDPLITTLKSERISYPDNVFGCLTESKQDPVTGHIECDYPETVIQKLIGTYVRDETPANYYMLSRFFISIVDIYDLIDLHKDGGGPHATSFEASCAWAKANEDKMANMAPPCLSSPKAPKDLKIGDSVFDPQKLKCVTIDCKPDQYILTGATGVSCKTCGNGLVPTADRTGCQTCSAGATPNRTDGTCAPCPKGYSCRYGAETPQACDKGSVTSKPQMLACERCDKGRYQPLAGQGACEACPAAMTTMVLGAQLALDCVCPAAMYKYLNATDANGNVKDKSIPACNPCPPGMTCPEGSDEINIPCIAGAFQKKNSSGANKMMYPVPEHKFYSECTNLGPLSAYKCFSGKSCPGGDVQVCGTGLEGIACGRCMDKWYRDGEICEPCSPAEKSNGIFPTLPLILAPIGICALYFKSRDPVELWGSPANSLTTALFLILVYVQTLAAISACYMTAPPVMVEGMAWTQFTYDLLSVLKPGCTTFGDFQVGFIGKLLLPFHALVMVVVTFIGSRVVGLVKPAVAMNFDITFNMYWALFNTFFIGIAQQTFTLFQCYKHPNGEKSMRSQADVICGDDTWNSLMAIALVCIVIFCGGFLVLNIWVALVAPRKFVELRFQRRFKFLFIKFRPSCWYWGLTLLVKGIWLNLPTVIFDFGAAQVLWLQSFITLYLVGCFAYMPWRNFMVTVVDIMMHATLIFVFGFVTHFVDMGDSNEDALGLSYVFFACAPIVFGLCVVVRMIYRRFIAPSHDAQYWFNEASEACTIFSKTTSNADLAKVMAQLPFADLVSLNNAKHILQAELFFNSTPRSSSSDSLLRAATRQRLATSSEAKAANDDAPCGDDAAEGKEVKDSDDVQKSMQKMKALVKPEEAWLCQALEAAATQQPYDVDTLRNVTGKTMSDSAEGAEPLDDLDFPGEYTGALLNRDVASFAPRSVPNGRLTNPHFR